MILKESRLCHLVGYKAYLAEPGIGKTAYRNLVRKVYGNLRGVKFIELPPGTRLETTGLRGDAWRICK